MKLIKELTQSVIVEKYETTGFVNDNEDSSDVEDVDSRGEEYGHFTVTFYKNGKIEVIANTGNLTKQQEKPIIEVAKKEIN